MNAGGYVAITAIFLVGLLTDSVRTALEVILFLSVGVFLVRLRDYLCS